MDTISVLIGFLIGVVATMIAVEFGLKKIFRPPAVNKVTGSWRLDDHSSPLVVTQDASGVALPNGSRVVTAGSVDPHGFSQRDHRRNPNARSNFVVDRDLDRALLFMGPIREGTLALATLDPAVAARLRAEHRKLWDTGEPYVAELSLDAVARNTGLLVRVRGRVQECVGYRENHLLRITDGSHVVGAIVEEPLRLDGQHVVVTGRVVRGTSGYPVLEAEEVRLENSHERISTRRATVPGGPVRQDSRPQTPMIDPALEPAPNKTSSPRSPAGSVNGPSRRVLRVPPRKTEKEREPEPAAEEPMVEFEEPPATPATLAEQQKARARVTLHR